MNSRENLRKHEKLIENDTLLRGMITLQEKRMKRFLKLGMHLERLVRSEGEEILDTPEAQEMVRELQDITTLMQQTSDDALKRLDKIK